MDPPKVERSNFAEDRRLVENFQSAELIPNSVKILISIVVIVTIINFGLSAATFANVQQFRVELKELDAGSRRDSQELLQDILADSKNNSALLKYFIENETKTLQTEISGLDTVRNNYARLSGNGTKNYGRVEILYQGEWGTICDDVWDINDARVICRMLGYNGASAAPGRAQFGKGSGRIWLDDVQCIVDEPTIWQCASRAWGTTDCGHSEDASVICT